MATNANVNIGDTRCADKISCTTCAYGRRPDGVCDVFGTRVSNEGLCRSFRTPGQGHGEARKEYPLLGRLRPGVVYTAQALGAEAELAIHAAFALQQVPREEPRIPLGDVLWKTHPIKVLNIDGSESEARFDCYQSGLIVLTMRDVRYWSSDKADVYSALRQIRISMEQDGRIPLINGANRNAFSRGTSGDMDGGYSIYLMTTNGEAVEKADTFGGDRVSDAVYVAEQDLFSESIFKPDASINLQDRFQGA